ncbi:MAG: hypothetical protein JSW07_07485, partial [bacterium]
MTETKVAAFFQSAMKEEPEARWVWEQKKVQNPFTPETALVAAVTYLRKQSRSPLRLTYFSQLYFPLYLLHINADDSLIISGIGRSSVTLKNVTVLPPEAFEDLLSHVEEVQQVPRLIENLEKLIKNLDPTRIIIPNFMKPSMIDPLRRLIETSLSLPSKNEWIESHLSTNEIIDLGSKLRTEIKRLERCREHLIQMVYAINQYIEGQLQYINEQRLKIHEDTAAELAMAQVLGQLEEILKFAALQCRQFIIQMDASPTQTELIMGETSEDLQPPQMLAHDFRQSLQQTSIGLDVAFTQLDEAERRWQSVFEQEKIGRYGTPLMESSGETHQLHSPRKMDAFSTDSQLRTLVSLRERIISSYPKLRQSLNSISTKLEKQYERFRRITVKADDLRGDQSLIRILIPVFIAKVKRPARYGIIPPLKLLRPALSHHWKHSKSVPPVKAFNVKLFDEPFCLQLEKLLRTDMLTKPEFRSRLDQQALQNNWLNDSKRVKRFLQGI